MTLRYFCAHHCSMNRVEINEVENDEHECERKEVGSINSSLAYIHMYVYFEVLG